MNVVVLGAGVSGLTTAYRLTDEGHCVTLVAAWRRVLDRRRNLLLGRELARDLIFREVKVTA